MSSYGVDGTATAGDDFDLPATDALTFGPGVTMRVSVHRDHSDRSIVITQIGPS